MRTRKMMSSELCECHGHLMMDGTDYSAAKKRHLGHVDVPFVRGGLQALKDAGVRYFRDGGDMCGVSDACRDLPAEYGIEYVTPVFAIHKKGRYGGIVGRPFSDRKEYRQRVREVKELRGDFIKLIVSGIITFRGYGEVSCPPLDPDEIHEMIAIAHEEGFPVMIHVNGDKTVRACIEAGADSIEHGYFQEEETLRLLAKSETVWVPTLAATAAFIGRDGFDERIARETLERQMAAVKHAEALGAHIACGSDSGAVGVLHGPGTLREMELLKEAGLAEDEIDDGNRRIRGTFRRRHH